MDALGRGEVDCVFPANLTPFDGESAAAAITSPVISTDIQLVALILDITKSLKISV